jgi:hypothetical protein
MTSFKYHEIKISVQVLKCWKIITEIFLDNLIKITDYIKRKIIFQKLLNFNKFFIHYFHFNLESSFAPFSFFQFFLLMKLSLFKIKPNFCGFSLYFCTMAWGLSLLYFSVSFLCFWSYCFTFFCVILNSWGLPEIGFSISIQMILKGNFYSQVLP